MEDGQPGLDGLVLETAQAHVLAALGQPAPIRGEYCGQLTNHSSPCVGPGDDLLLLYRLAVLRQLGQQVQRVGSHQLGQRSG